MIKKKKKKTLCKKQQQQQQNENKMLHKNSNKNHIKDNAPIQQNVNSKTNNATNTSDNMTQMTKEWSQYTVQWQQEKKIQNNKIQITWLTRSLNM